MKRSTVFLVLSLFFISSIFSQASSNNQDETILKYLGKWYMPNSSTLVLTIEEGQSGIIVNQEFLDGSKNAWPAYLSNDIIFFYFNSQTLPLCINKDGFLLYYMAGRTGYATVALQKK